ncbi:hypothetical protein [Pseudenterobacter timonensis]|uniref:CHAP domain-containing protein n=1 Tax=Pseudenterobacter timonensis TaxID=1755099 RepID=A0ABV4AAU8_9ENTR
MSWNPGAAATYARQHAMSSSHSLCATYLRRALHAGGINILGIRNAKDYGPALERQGFVVVAPGQTLKTGDIVVIQPYAGGNPAGHIAIFDGKTWISDFRQRDIWAGPGYRAQQPPHKIYRRY